MNHPVGSVLASRRFLIPAAVLVLYSVMGFLITPLLVRWYVPKFAREQFKREAVIGKVRINPFLLRAEINDFSLQDEDGSPLIGFERFSFDLEMSSIYRWAGVFREVRLNKPVVNLVIGEDGTLNLSRLAAKPTEQNNEERNTSNAKPTRLFFGKLELIGGEAWITDSRQAGAVVNFQDLNVDVKDLSTYLDRNGSFSFRAKTENGESLEWQGEINMVPFRSRGKVLFNGIQAATLWRFQQKSLNLDPPSGTLNISGDYAIDAANPSLQVVLENVQMDISQAVVKLSGSDSPFFELGRFEFDCALVDLAARTIHTRKLMVDGGRLDLRIDETGVSNLEKLVRKIPAGENPEKGGPPDNPGPQVSNGGSVSSPEVVGGQTLAGDSTEPVSEVPWKVNIDVVEVKDVAFGLEDLSRASPLSAAVESISLSSKVDIEAGSGLAVSAGEVAVELKGVRLGSKGEPKPLFEARQISVEGGEVDLAARSLSIARIGVNGGHCDLGLTVDGNLNLEGIISPETGFGTGTEIKPSAAKGQPWDYHLKIFEISNFRSALSDRRVLPDKDLYSLRDIGGRVTGIDGKSPMNFEVGFAVEQGGKLAFSGKVDPESLSVEARVDVAGLALPPLQPYLEPYITLTLQSAAVSTRGVFHYGLPQGKSKLTYEGSVGIDKLSLNQPKSKATYLGWESMQIPQLRLSMAPNSLQIPEILLSKPVGELIISEDRSVNLTKIVKDRPSESTRPPASSPAAKRRAKTAAITKTSPAGSPGKQHAEPFTFSIGRIRVSDGKLLFADLSLTPKFMTRIHHLKGTVSKIGSEKNNLTGIQLEGLVDQYGFAKMSGILDLSDFTRSCDVNMVFRNVEMASINPYSGKFAGRRIKSGKLSLDLKYRIQNNKLVGDNRIIVDNLVLGEKVESPEAVNLPLDLAVALLSDANGRIDLGLPLSGDLSNPQFEIWPLIRKALGNIITKAVTLPFKALGSLLGGGENKRFEAVEFEPGQTVLLPPEKEKLKNIAGALQRKVRLKLVVRGRYSPEIDGMEMKKLDVRRAVAARMGMKLTPDEESESLDLIDPETVRALEKVFAERFGLPALDELDRALKEGKIQPRDVQEEPERKKKAQKGSIFSRVFYSAKLYKVVPGAKSPDQLQILAGELYARLVESQPVDEKTLVEIAEDRSAAIRRELQEVDNIPEERIVTREPEAAADESGLAADLSVDVVAGNP